MYRARQDLLQKIRIGKSKINGRIGQNEEIDKKWT